jgi:hypothetical protein
MEGSEMKIPNKNELDYYRCCYPAGTRIQLDADMDDPQPILAGTKGTILAIDDMAQAVVKWDNGRSLSLIIGHDRFHKLQFENNEKLVGHAVDGNKNLRNIRNVAEFILTHGAYGDVTITTEIGEPFISTSGTEITFAADKDYLEKLNDTIEEMRSAQEEEDDMEMSQL